MGVGHENVDAYSTSTSVSIQNVFCMILVAALWGCTNPLLARGMATRQYEKERTVKQHRHGSFFIVKVLRQRIPKCMQSLLNFSHLSILFPYAANQCGSILYYYTLASCNLSLVVPCCNALSLAFSFGTSYFIGEKVNSPLRAALGSILVTIGVAICTVETSSRRGDQTMETDSFLSNDLEF
jgi:uncharacterized membrane protein